MRRPQNLKKSPTCFAKTVVFTQCDSVASKQVGDFFKFFWPSQKSLTLKYDRFLQKMLTSFSIFLTFFFEKVTIAYILRNQTRLCMIFSSVMSILYGIKPKYF